MSNSNRGGIRFNKVCLSKTAGTTTLHWNKNTDLFCETCWTAKYTKV